MKVESTIQVTISKQDLIKPNSPTPDDVRHYQLSFLDQTSPPFFIPWILFYPPSNNITEKSDHLKKSLSQVLPHFYPIAGRINGNNFVDCNDEGVPFLEAQVQSCSKEDVIQNPNPVELAKLLPFDVVGEEINHYGLGVQFNVFKCGGVAVGVCLSHKIGDASSLFTFLKTWADLSCREEIQPPNFTSNTLFPNRELPDFYDPSLGIVKSDVIAKRFMFGASALEALKTKYASESKATSAEALSIFVWSRFIEATKTETEKLHFMMQAVYFRSRLEPPIPEHSFGNYSCAIVTNTFSSGEIDFNTLLNQSRDAIKKVYSNHVTKLKEGVKFLEMLKEVSQEYKAGEVAPLGFSNWCEFPLYEGDFGWGKPVFGGTPPLPLKNFVFLRTNATGDGIEAFVHLGKEDMTKLEQDHELLQYAT